MKRTEVKIAMADRSTFTVSGYEFDLEGVTLVVHRISPELGWEDTCPDGWSVTEPITGRAISNTIHRTRSGACMAAEGVMHRKGPQAFLKAIERHREAA